MKLSIVVPVYNMAADNKLRFCLDSLINQSIADYEIIAVDDASTDESLEILREYESKYPWKFKAIQQYAKEQGCYNVTLNVWACNESARCFYEHCGLVPQKIGMEKIL